MGKKVKDRILAIVVTITKDSGSPAKISCRADYEVTAEGLTESRSLALILSNQQENAIKKLGLDVLSQIKDLEEAD